LKLTLKHPIKFGSEMITELTFRKPKAKDFRSFPAGTPTMGDILTLVGHLANQPDTVVDELSVEDMAAVSKVIDSFTGGQETGSTS
jgi:hypothetical protein